MALSLGKMQNRVTAISTKLDVKKAELETARADTVDAYENIVIIRSRMKTNGLLLRDLQIQLKFLERTLAEFQNTPSSLGGPK
tara:strand:+ start:1090 stop:1338 length:249 start_codon:yes stop_codon:yes gene_type:complete